MTHAFIISYTVGPNGNIYADRSTLPTYSDYIEVISPESVEEDQGVKVIDTTENSYVVIAKERIGISFSTPEHLGITKYYKFSRWEEMDPIESCVVVGSQTPRYLAIPKGSGSLYAAVYESYVKGIKKTKIPEKLKKKLMEFGM